MNVESHIESLLYRYDCVIIPGFGGFVVNRKNAEINEANDQFNPPVRQIIFNQNLTRNDGLLCDAVAAADKTTYQAAVEKVEDFNRDNLRRLSEGQEIVISDIGTFRNDTSGILQFEPNRDANFMGASFGLFSFRSPAIKREGVEHVIEKKILETIHKQAPVVPVKSGVADSVSSVTSVKVAKRKLNLVRYWPAAAVILVLIVASSILMNTNVLKSVSINYSDLVPFESSIESLYSARTNELKFDGSSVAKDEIDLWLESIPEKKAVKAIHTPNKVKRFHIIGGCFKIMANAKKMIRRLEHKGFEPALVGKNKRGLQRVAFGSYATRAEAKEVLRYIKSTQMSSSWLYVSKK